MKYRIFFITFSLLILSTCSSSDSGQIIYYTNTNIPEEERQRQFEIDHAKCLTEVYSVQPPVSPNCNRMDSFSRGYCSAMNHSIVAQHYGIQRTIYNGCMLNKGYEKIVIAIEKEEKEETVFSRH